ncbi:unnamed protein product [Lactuca virosa]|uniref:Uncharacterized protein n=1 Tax=Lactuca virosa TaxID=75947 RepID=A0AAU9MNB5_9ASTR|nr:unnamed protein product [Lactuca virosa]
MDRKIKQEERRKDKLGGLGSLDLLPFDQRKLLEAKARSVFPSSRFTELSEVPVRIAGRRRHDQYTLVEFLCIVILG